MEDCRRLGTFRVCRSYKKDIHSLLRSLSTVSLVLLHFICACPIDIAIGKYTTPCEMYTEKVSYHDLSK